MNYQNAAVFSPEEKKRIFHHLKEAVGFELFIHRKFVGQKRFSLEGSEILVPALNYMIEKGAELGIRGKSDPARDCMDVLRRLESSFPELAGFVFWSDAGFYNVVGNLNGRELMAHPKIITLGE